MPTLNSAVLRIAAGRVALAGALLWFAGGSVAHSASPSIAVSSQSVAPGSSVLVTVNLATQGALISGVQFDLEYDNAALSLSTAVGDAVRNSGKSLYLADPALSRKRFFILGWDQNSMSDGALVRLFVNVASTASPGAYALKLSTVLGTGPGGWSVALNATDGAVTVQGTAADGAPLPSAGVLNAASLLPGAVAPGEAVTLLGSGIGPAVPLLPVDAASALNLAGVTVWFDAAAAPLLYAGPNQINVMTPFAVAGQSTSHLQVAHQGTVFAALNVPVAAASPAIFTLDASGVGPGAILNQDATINSAVNPAAKGSVVTLFATGAGQTDPAGVDGQLAASPLPQPVLGVSVKIGGLSAEIRYAGAAPGEIAGILQVNCVVPDNAPTGTAVPLVLQAGTWSGPVGATLAIQ